MRRPFLRGVLFGVMTVLLLGLLGAAYVIWSGRIDVAATNRSPAVALASRVLGYASSRSIRHHAETEANPNAKDPAAVGRGLEHYREMCVDCHGGPGAEPEEFAAGLHPLAPDLASDQVQSFSDGMLYTAIAGGIGSTGMPAFGPTHSRQDIWDLVTFVRRLPSMSESEKAALGKKASGHHDDAGHGDHSAPAGAAKPGAQEAGDANGRVHKVVITSFAFVPATLDVAQGDTVVWTNRDFVAHTATSKDKTFDTGKLDTNQSKRIVVDKKGSFAYFCRYHAGMKATLIVH